jgi:chaperonin cofactor prefoldin
VDTLRSPGNGNTYGSDRRSASLTTWTTILTTTEQLASEHDAFSTALNAQVADVLKNLATRYDDYRKRYESLSTKLLEERDKVYDDLKKAKSTYDLECKGVEEKRQKVDKSYDSSKTKAQKSYQNELAEMSNVKVIGHAFMRYCADSSEHISSADRRRKQTQTAVLS